MADLHATSRGANPIFHQALGFPERGLQLTKQHNCEHLPRPIIEFQPPRRTATDGSISNARAPKGGDRGDDFDAMDG
jgi:hypothetical protein